jgi:hypothetical protein
MDCVLVGMVALFCDRVRDIVDRDNAVEQHHDHEQQQKQREIVQKRVTHDPSTLSLRGRSIDQMALTTITRGIVWASRMS